MRKVIQPPSSSARKKGLNQRFLLDMESQDAPTDLYALLGVEQTATPAEIKKAYHKIALKCHPDKVPADQRERADGNFKAIKQAFEILRDEQKRKVYDIHGLTAFENGGAGLAPGEGMPMDDFIGRHFGFKNRDPNGPFSNHYHRPTGPSQVEMYPIVLEDLYKGKTCKFMAERKVICTLCKGQGGRERAEPKECETCKGTGTCTKVQPMGHGAYIQGIAMCGTCSGRGKFFRHKDKCKRCKGERILVQSKPLEFWVAPGASGGDDVCISSGADQSPDWEAGDLIFRLAELKHARFARNGADLSAHLDITLLEALTGFSRVVLLHLDGRGIHLSIKDPSMLPLTPEQYIRIVGEGMPVVRQNDRGDLYLKVRIAFPEKGWLASPADQSGAQMQQHISHEARLLATILPSPAPPINVPSHVLDEREPDFTALKEHFGRTPAHGRRRHAYDFDHGGRGGNQASVPDACVPQ